MYESHFGLTRRPFRPTPDAGAYYPATTHEAALAELRAALDGPEPVALLTAEPGLGKTLLAHRLLHLLDEKTRTVVLTNTHLGSRAALLQAALFDLRLPYQGLTEQELRLAWSEACLEHFQAGGRTLLVADEAHHLGAELLEEIRMWGNLEAEGERAVQALLIGLPGLLGTLALPELGPLRQRITTAARLEPMGKEESIDYLLHQVRSAGGRPEAVFTDEALELIAENAAGVPRLLNRFAGGALRLAAEVGAEAADAEAVLEVIARQGTPPAAAAGTAAEAEPGPESEPAPHVLRLPPPGSGEGAKRDAEKPNRVRGRKPMKRSAENDG